MGRARGRMPFYGHPNLLNDAKGNERIESAKRVKRVESEQRYDI